jgi:hypothetical protein
MLTGLRRRVEVRRSYQLQLMNTELHDLLRRQLSHAAEVIVVPARRLDIMDVPDEPVTVGLDVIEVHPSASFALRLVVTRTTAASYSA